VCTPVLVLSDQSMRGGMEVNMMALVDAAV